MFNRCFLCYNFIFNYINLMEYSLKINSPFTVIIIYIIFRQNFRSLSEKHLRIHFLISNVLHIRLLKNIPIFSWCCHFFHQIVVDIQTVTFFIIDGEKSVNIGPPSMVNKVLNFRLMSTSTTMNTMIGLLILSSMYFLVITSDIIIKYVSLFFHPNKSGKK